MFREALNKITAEGVAIAGLISIAILSLIMKPEPETVVIAIASGLIGYIKGTGSNNTQSNNLTEFKGDQ